MFFVDQIYGDICWKKYLGINVMVSKGSMLMSYMTGSMNIYEIHVNIKSLLWINVKRLILKEIYRDWCKNNN